MFSRHASRDGQVGEQPGNGGSGDMIIVRYADDIVVGFQHEADARRFREAMRERLGKFALSLHPDKTRLLEFGRFAAANRERRGSSKPETFDLGADRPPGPRLPSSTDDHLRLAQCPFRRQTPEVRTVCLNSDLLISTNLL